MMESMPWLPISSTISFGGNKDVASNSKGTDASDIAEKGSVTSCDHPMTSHFPSKYKSIITKNDDQGKKPLLRIIDTHQQCSDNSAIHTAGRMFMESSSCKNKTEIMFAKCVFQLESHRS